MAQASSHLTSTPRGGRGQTPGQWPVGPGAEDPGQPPEAFLWLQRLSALSSSSGWGSGSYIRSRRCRPSGRGCSGTGQRVGSTGKPPSAWCTGKQAHTAFLSAALGYLPPQVHVDVSGSHGHTILGLTCSMRSRRLQTEFLVSLRGCGFQFQRLPGFHEHRSAEGEGRAGSSTLSLQSRTPGRAVSPEDLQQGAGAGLSHR